ncbi:phosphotransferase [Ectocarpus siliculosus]|uniref:2'-phosphotransferase n=1 Tax=Ectocarpus siliculosus TaxID=2880 RepID=D7FZZ0_ECTSI|nr:phosphotransferase [Ectocarpus siliculosus]|eukprot:CBJ48615.1 phosphotransferase [Ectocarpus siliculosus]
MRQDDLDQGANGLGLSVAQQKISSSGSDHGERDARSQGGRGRGRGGRRGRHDDPRVQLSKRLTYALRHGAEKLGLRLRPDGFVSLDELLSKPSFRGVSREQVEQVVASDEKGRMTIATFPVSGGEAAGSASACADPGAATNQAVFIRANQGHSVKGVIDEEKLLTRVEDAADVPVCVHGTDRKSWSNIREEGLRCMNRTHIHFAAGLPGESGVISGMRKACKVLIYVDVAAAMSDGVAFFRSTNNPARTAPWSQGTSPALTALLLPRAKTLRRTSRLTSMMQLRGMPRRCHRGRGKEDRPRPDNVRAREKKGKWNGKANNTHPLPCAVGKFGPMEVIEFPTVLLDAHSLKVLDEFRVYVRPVRHPILTPFCTSLTGIEQSTVDGGVLFEEALSQHTEFLRRNSCLPGQERSCLFVTCGNWDLKTMMPAQCKLIDAPVPPHFNSWANIKEVFRDVMYRAARQSQRRPRGGKVGGMPAMLSALGLVLEGRHHSGLDDCRNIARIAIELCRRSRRQIQATAPWNTAAGRRW